MKLFLYFKLWNLKDMRSRIKYEWKIKHNYDDKVGETIYRLFNIAVIKQRRKIKGEEVHEWPKYNKIEKIMKKL